MQKNKKSVVIALFIILVIAIGIFFFFKTEGAPYIIKSADGSAELMIPKNSLPDDVLVEDISIRPVSKEDFPAEIEALEVLALYRLQPHGLTFKQPVSFKITVPEQSKSWLPNALHLSNGVLEWIETISTEIQADNTIALSGEIMHFSDIVTFGGFFSIEAPSELGSFQVGKEFSVPITITKRDRYDVGPPGWGGHGFELEDGTAFVSRAKFKGRGVEEISSEIDLTEVDLVQDETRYLTTFVCTEAGDHILTYRLHLVYGTTTYYTGLASPLNIFAGSDVKIQEITRMIKIKCTEIDDQEFIDALDFEVEISCGGAINVTGSIDHDSVESVNVSVTGDVSAAQWYFSSRTFEYYKKLEPGTYSVDVRPVTVTGEKTLRDVSKIVQIEPCPPDPPEEYYDPILGIDPVAPATPDPVFIPDPDPIPDPIPDPVFEPVPAPEEEAFVVCAVENFYGTCNVNRLATPEEIEAGCPNLPLCS